MRRSGLALAASVLAGSAFWLTRATLAVTGDGPGLGRIGLLPPLSHLLLGSVLAAAALLLLRRRAIPRLPILILGLLALPWLPGPIPAAFLVWTGGVAGAVWVATMIALAVGAADRFVSVPGSRLVRDPKLAPWTAALLACVLYLGMAWCLSPRRPIGDEPHYLIITQSLLGDGDLRIENNHRDNDYLAYIDDHRLDPDFLRRGTDGQIYSVHAPGLPALTAPAFLAFGHAGVVSFLAVLAALGTGLAWWLAYLVTASAPGAWFGWAAVSLTAPFFFHAFAVFPDAPAATLTLVGIWGLIAAGGRERKPPELRGHRTDETGAPPLPSWRWMLHGAALALLPWLHARYAAPAAMIGAALVLRLAPGEGGLRRVTALLAVPVANAAAWFGFFFAIYGSFNPAAPYGGYTQSSLGQVPSGLAGLLFDQQFGLVSNAPVYLLVLPGLVMLARDGRRRLAGELVLSVLPYLVLVGAYRMWWGGASAPARFAVPSLLVLAVPLACLWSRAGRAATRALAVTLLAASVLMCAALGFVDQGRLLENQRDGYSRLLESLSVVVDLTMAVPSVLRDPWSAVLLQTLVWIAGVAFAWSVLAAIERGRPARRDLLAAATPLVAGAAVMAACTAAWWLAGSSGVRPAVSQARLLSRYEAGSGRVIGYAERGTLPESQLLSRLALESSGRRRAPGPSVLFSLPWLPAGRYRVEPGPGAIPAGSRLWFGIGDSNDLVMPVDFDDAPAGGPLIDVPVDVAAPFLTADQNTDLKIPGDARLALRPVLVESGNRLGGTGLARRASRYEPAAVYLLGEGAYVEPSGLWIVPQRRVRLAIAPAAPASTLRLFLRNAPVANTLTVTSGRWETRLDLDPGEERSIEVPRTRGDAATLLDVRVAAGFRPVLVEPATGDYRQLGCWLEVR